MSTFNFPPFTTITEEDDGSVSYGGTEYMVFNAVAQKLNFNFSISEPVFCCLWGGTRVDGSEDNYTGMVGDLHGGFADVAWNAMYYKVDRMKLMDYTMANNFVESGFMVGTLKKQHT